MKLFKRLAVIFTALVLSLSVFAIAACNKNGGKKTDYEQIVEKLDKASASKLEIASNITIKDKYESYRLDAAGKKTDSYSNKSQETLKVNILADVASGNVDFSMDMSEKDLQDSTTDDWSYYFFMRDWNLFDVDSSDKITDFSNISLYYSGTVHDLFEEDETVGVDFEKLLTENAGTALPSLNKMLITLAESNNAFTAENGTAVIDFNKMAYNLAAKIIKVLDSITLNSTIASIWTNADFVSIVKPLLNIVSAEDVHTVLAEFLKQNDLYKYDVAPDSGSSTYDYLVKLICSKEINELVGSLISSEEGALPCDVKDLKISFILNQLGITENQEEMLKHFKETVKELVKDITETTFAFAYEETYETSHDKLAIEVSGAKMAYTYDDEYNITAQSATAKFSMKDYYSSTSSYDSYYRNSELELTAEATVSYPATVTLKDISACKVIKFEYLPYVFATNEMLDISGYALIYSSNGSFDVFECNFSYILTQVGDDYNATFISFKNPVNDEDVVLVAANGMQHRSDDFQTYLDACYMSSDDNGKPCIIAVIYAYAYNYETKSRLQYEFAIPCVRGGRTVFENTVAGVLSGKDFQEVVTQ